MTNQVDLRVLVAEDEPISRQILATKLGAWGYTVELAEDGTEAWDILGSATAPPLALLDWNMPGITGPDICRRLRNDSERPYSYLIILTSNNSTADLVEALDAGADDFISKPFNHEELRVRLRVGQRIVTLQQELQRRSSYDDLTGLLNRRTFIESLRRVHDRSARGHTGLGLAMLDLDHFKRINDDRGHQAGDIVLREVARRIAASVRPTDLTCRYGGEEFVVAMPGCSAEAAAGIGERLRAVVNEIPIDIPGSSISATVSVGIAVSPATPMVSYDRLLDSADRALYRAKASGRNRVEICDALSLRIGASRRAS